MLCFDDNMLPAVFKVASVVSTRAGTETPATDLEDPDDALLCRSPETEGDVVQSSYDETMAQAFDMLEQISPTETRPAFPPPGLTPPPGCALVSGEWGTAVNVVHQVHWTVDRKKISSKSSDRQVVSPAFEFLFGGYTEKATFRIMLHALAKSPDGKTASFRNSGGRGLVQLKCETPEKVPHQIQCRMWAGRSSSCAVLIHDFSASTMCRMEEIDFGGAGDLELLANTLCIELLPCCPLSVVNVTEMRTDSLSPGRSSNESTRKLPKAEGKKSSTLVSYKTQPCRFFWSKKGCSKGDLCTYAHEDIPSTCVQTQASQFYKTRLCSVFTKVGKCSLGDSCTFAHGSEELLQRGSHKLDDASQTVDLGRFQRCSVNCTTTLNLGEDGTPATTMPQSLTQHTLTWPLASGQNRGGPWACGPFGIRDPFFAAQNRTFGPDRAARSFNFAMERPPSVGSTASAEGSHEGMP